MNTSIQIAPVKDGKRLLMVCVAAFIMALNIRTLVHTGGLIPGGATGMTILIQRLVKLLLSVDLPYTPVNLLLNAIPVYIGFRFIGKKFTLLSLVMIMLSGFLTDLIPAYTLTQDILLISIFGGIVNGFAISLCLRADGHQRRHGFYRDLPLADARRGILESDPRIQCGAAPDRRLLFWPG